MTYRQWKNKFQVCHAIPDGAHLEPLDSASDHVILYKSPLTEEASTALATLTDYHVEDNGQAYFDLKRKTKFKAKQ